jgi:SnoaL-like domain
MKKIYILSIIVLLLACGCTNREDTDTLDQTKLIASLEKVADQYLEAWNNKDLNTLDKLTANDGEYYGSDPEEIMDKQALMEMYSLFFEDTTSSYIYTVDTRNIRVSPNGNSAVIMERITFPQWSPKMPICQTSHLIKTKGNWKIDFISWGFIIKNDDVEKINEIL